MTTHDTDDRDERVSAAYRELDHEKAPEHLDRAILDMAAASSASSRSALFNLWMKPVAWAATIGLCLAIVLEYNEVPSTGVPAVVAPGPASVRDDFVPAHQDSLEEVSNRAKLQLGPGAETVTEEEPVENIDLSTVEQKRKTDSFSASAPSASQSARQLTESKALPLEVTNPQSIPVPLTEESIAAEAAVEEVVIDDTPPASGRSVEVSEMASYAVAPAALSGDSMGSQAGTPCNATIREVADSWLECILELRHAGFDAIADEEYELFARDFPADWAEYEANK